MIKTLTTLLALLSLPALAENKLQMKGIVPVKLLAEVTSLPVALTLPLDVTQNDLRVASGKFRSNSGSGFKVTVQSINRGNLKRVGGNELFPYTLKFGSLQIPLTQASPLSYSDNGTLNISDNFTISYNGKLSSDMTAGDYLDTITFTMTAL